MKPDTKEHILRTASDLFYRNGYNLTGINEIIEESGIAKATLYSHFRSKKELCLAYLDAKDEDLLLQISQFCAAKPSGDKQLLGIIQFLKSYYERGDFYGCWCIRTLAEIPSHEETIRSKIRLNKAKFIDFISELVKNNKPKLSKAKQSKLARRIYLIYESAVSETHLQDADWPIDESIDLLKNVLKTTV